MITTIIHQTHLQFYPITKVLQVIKLKWYNNLAIIHWFLIAWQWHIETKITLWPTNNNAVTCLCKLGLGNIICNKILEKLNLSTNTCILKKRKIAKLICININYYVDYYVMIRIWWEFVNKTGIIFTVLLSFILGINMCKNKTIKVWFFYFF